MGPTCLNKSPIKKAMQYYSGRVVKPDQTKLGSTKPNIEKFEKNKLKLVKMWCEQ